MSDVPPEPPRKDAPPADRLEDARRRVRGVADLLAAARRAMADGHLPRLADLEDLTRAACRSVQALPPEDGRDLLESLEAVRYDLDALATDLTDRFGDLARRPAGPPRGGPRSSIGAAYQAPPAAPHTDEEA